MDVSITTEENNSISYPNFTVIMEQDSNDNLVSDSSQTQKVTIALCNDHENVFTETRETERGQLAIPLTHFSGTIAPSDQISRGGGMI